jgi:hypothetical protein
MSDGMLFLILNTGLVLYCICIAVFAVKVFIEWRRPRARD